MPEERLPPPRNYFLISPPQAEEIVRRNPPGRFTAQPGTLTGCLELLIKTRTHLHIGNGAYALHGGEIVKDIARRAGIPVIPGSGIKGPVRQIYEVLTSSADPLDDRLSKYGPGLSAAGRVFGALGYQGRVGFEDAEPRGACELVVVHVSVPYPPRSRREGRRFYGPMSAGADQPRSIPVLAFPPDCVLATRLHFDALEKIELAGVLRSMGLATDPQERFFPRLGGAKYDAFGEVEIGVNAVSLAGIDQRLALGANWERGPEAVDAFVMEILQNLPLEATAHDRLERLIRGFRGEAD
jgi:hypothetical protein